RRRSIRRSLLSAQLADRWSDCRCRRELPAIIRERSPLQFGGFVAMLPDSVKKSAKSYRKSFCQHPIIDPCPGILTFLLAATSWSPVGSVLLVPPSPGAWLHSAQK